MPINTFPALFITPVTANSYLYATFLPRAMTTSSRYSPSQYLAGILRHEKAVLKAIFTEYFPGIRQFVRHNKGSEQDAEDVFMDALEALYRQVRDKGLKDLSCSFYTYLFEICKRLWLKKLRKGKFHSSVTPEDLAVLTGDEDPQEALEETERHGLFWEKFILLGKDCQRLLVLSLLEKKSSEEIAETMGYASAGYVRKRKHECKEQLVSYIEVDPRFSELRLA